MHDFQEQVHVKFMGGEWQLWTQPSNNMVHQFISSTEQEIEKLLDDKDSENTNTLGRKTFRSQATKRNKHNC